MKADVLPFLKKWWFFMLSFFKPELLLLKVGSNLKIFLESGVIQKNKYSLKFFSQNKFSWKFQNPILKLFSRGSVFKKFFRAYFCFTTYYPKKIIIFDLTLSSNNSGLINDSIKNQWSWLFELFHWIFFGARIYFFGPK